MELIIYFGMFLAILTGTLTIYLAVLALILAGMWKVFEKAGESSWKSLVPFYHTWVLIRMVGRPPWFFILIYIPFVGTYFFCALINDLSKGFGKGWGFTVGIIFLPFVFLPMLGFGDATWTKPGGAAPAASAAPSSIG